MTFAEKLKILRKQKNITQVELASAIDVSFAIIGQIESGARNPSKEVAKKLADYFNVALDVFIVESAPIEQNGAQHIKTGDLLAIADIVAEYFNKHGYELTPEQRVALVEHFYQENIITKDEINKLLSLMQVMSTKRE
jgi:transcriptional regulator with XRE-family HTH domain